MGDTHLDSGIGGGGISTSHLRGSIVAMVLRVATRVLQVYDGESVCNNESSPVQNNVLDNVRTY